MPPLEIVIGLLVATIPLVAIGARRQIPYPVALVIGGMALGFVPGLPPVRLSPDLVLLVFLPPVLYWEAVSASTDEMRANGRWVWPLAIGLVAATTAVVAVVARSLIPALPWAACFVLGAIVAPTDEVAVAPIAERLRVPRHLQAIVEGESLVNDAVSLVLYATAVAAVVTGTFSLGHTVLQLVLAAAGALLLGLLVGRVAVMMWRWFRDPELQLIVSIVVPFLAYIPAQHLGLSGVLAVIVAGAYVNRRTPVVLSPATRIRGVGYWESVVFLLNALLFILVGLQLRAIVTTTFARHPWPTVLLEALAVNLTVVAVRIVWVYAQGALPWTWRDADGPAHRRHLGFTAAAGLRGGISLAAALALPATVASGAGFPDRDLIVFLTFSVVVVTLVGGGLALPAIIRRLHIEEDTEEAADTREAIAATGAAALAAIDTLERDGALDAAHAERLREPHRSQLAHLDGGDGARRSAGAEAERTVLHAQRDALLALRAAGKIDNVVLRRFLLTLDMAEMALARTTEVAEDAVETPAGG